MTEIIRPNPDGDGLEIIGPEGRRIVPPESATDIVDVEIANRGLEFPPDEHPVEDADGQFGIRAFAELTFRTRCGGWIHGPRIETPGVWGIGFRWSDNDGMAGAEAYAREAYGEDETAQLDEMLGALGVQLETEGETTT